MDSIENYSDQAIEVVMVYGPKIILAIIVLIVGLMLISPVVNLTRNTLNKRNVEPTVIPFLTGLVGAILKIMLFIAVAGMLGVETTSFIAVLGAAGLAIGLALQGSLSNFAGGVLILLFKPFKVGDFIEGQGHSGVVKEISILYTVLNTPDNKRVVIPNGNLSNNSMINYSAENTRRVDFMFGVGYDDDIKLVKDTISEVFKSEDRILNTPASVIQLHELGDSSVNFAARAWVKTADYWDVYWSIMEKIKVKFDEKGINIPYPQRDIHVYQTETKNNEN
ncbi:mechanosensitive ion channel family protein [Marinigracilibium pacificum]|uniref:Mechanosensitive ion channel n=1 Tax=Marinigracilibium pacificum TaxID=2729599 RepID=A0A848J6W9_9BACT|nr:mechanosensitive ion channel domain-containing protein [Marinigracilibium pacificum]NMM50194.1 mechanosensitive ion channel [Marinigracilibium pacificum]